MKQIIFAIAALLLIVMALYAQAYDSHSESFFVGSIILFTFAITQEI